VRVRRSTTIFVAACFVAWCAFTARPNVWAQLASMSAVIAALFWLVVLVVQGAIRWREKGLQNLVACLLVIAVFPAAVLCGKAIRSAVFDYQLDRWNRAVTWVTTTHLPNQGDLIRLPAPYSDLAYGVHYTHDEDCGLMIDFFWGGGFPVKHTVRRYAANRKWLAAEQCTAGWSRGREIGGRWYEISD
jgi:hypothetical protein